MSNLQAINEIVSKWRLNRTLLAEKMSMTKTTFVKSLNGQKYYRFTDEQLRKLKSILVELRTDLEAVDDVDFNEALRIITHGQREGAGRKTKEMIKKFKETDHAG